MVHNVLIIKKINNKILKKRNKNLQSYKVQSLLNRELFTTYVNTVYYLHLKSNTHKKHVLASNPA